MKPILRILSFLLFLTGITNSQVSAQCSPTLREIYDFEVGDQFFYRKTYRQDDGRPYYKYSYENFKIISKKHSGDTLQYIRLSDKTILDTLLFIDTVYHPLNRCFPVIDSTLPHCGNYWSLDKDFMRIYRIRDSNENHYKLFGTKEIGEVFSPDSMGYYNFELDDFIGFSLECYAIYREGIGLLNQGTFTFESGRYYELQKHIRGNDTLYITLSEPHDDLLTPSINMYPNPAQNSCQIECPFAIQEILVNDVAGRIQNIKVDIMTQSDWTINTSELIPGVYYVTLKTEYGSFNQQLLKY